MNTINKEEMANRYKETYQDRVECAAKEYNSRLKALELLDSMEGFEAPEGVEIRDLMLGGFFDDDDLGYIEFRCDGIKALHPLRKELRKYIPGYSDKVQNVYASGSMAVLEFETCNNLIRIQVKDNPENIPQSLFPDESCGFKRTQREVLEFSCTGRTA